MSRNYKLDSQQSHELVDQLLALRDETSPGYECFSEVQKNSKADRALVIAGHLIDDLVGWAMDHSMGVTLLGLSDEDRKGGHADRHEAEKIGADWEGHDVSRVREALARLIIIAGIVPLTARRSLSSALQALNLGEIKPLLQATDTHRWKGAHSLAKVRQHAVMHVFFIWGRKTSTKHAAREEVGVALGVSVSTLRTWEERWLPEIEPDVKSMFLVAKRAGEVQRLIDQDPGLETQDVMAKALADTLLSIIPLEAVAEQHRTTERQARAQPRRSRRMR